ncbi:MAG: oleate hydratase [Acetobacteraceae bacterium]|nr:oleate hydratase [Acetobacteraceae bacterium]
MRLSTNLGFLGQFAEVPRDVVFTIEYSARTAWEAIHGLLRRGPAATCLSGPASSGSAAGRPKDARVKAPARAILQAATTMSAALAAKLQTERFWKEPMVIAT